MPAIEPLALPRVYIEIGRRSLSRPITDGQHHCPQTLGADFRRCSFAQDVPRQLTEKTAQAPIVFGRRAHVPPHLCLQASIPSLLIEERT